MGQAMANGSARREVVFDQEQAHGGGTTSLECDDHIREPIVLDARLPCRNSGRSASPSGRHARAVTVGVAHQVSNPSTLDRDVPAARVELIV
jgi:hypothetical protein